MKFRWLLVVFLLIIPSMLYARWIKDKVVMPIEATGPVEFSHYSHLESVGKNCPSCHNKVFDIVVSNNPVFSMSDMEKGKSCGKCHDGKTAFSVKDDCTTCHNTREIAMDVAVTGIVTFSHDVHTDMFGCAECHPDLFTPQKGMNGSTMSAMEEGESCGACHDGDTAFGVKDDCSTCHPTRDITFNVAATGPVGFSHDVHTGMYGCGECHTGIFVPKEGQNTKTMSEMNSGASCGACHDGDTAFNVQEDCSTCHPTKDITFQVEETGPVAFSHDVHTSMYGCGECHTGIFVPKEGQNTKTMSEMNSGASCGACHDGDTAFNVQEDCTSCHPTKEITFQVEETGPVAFSHDVHTGMYGCGECHTGIFVPKEGQNKATMSAMNTGESCGACHDGDTAFNVQEDCTTCHPTKEITFQVKETGPVAFSHDVHTGMYGCGECHTGIFVPKEGQNKATMSAMNTGASCGACHDGDTAFNVQEDCSTCHPTRDITFQVEETGPVGFSHDVHTGMFGCGECHTDIFVPQEGKNSSSMSAMEGGASCGACHDGNTAFGVKDDCGSCHPTRDITFPEEDLGNVLFSHDVHTSMFGCGECHTDLFVPKAGETIVGMEAMESGESCGACHNGDTAFSVAEDCESCHKM